MTATYDAVVVGSGFGGSVTAARLAEAGWSVLVLERGRAYPPGSFPRAPRGLGRNFWDPEAERGGLYGLFDIWSFEQLDAVTASGLGGGSLIYANVMLRKPEETFVQDGGQADAWEHWPVRGPELTEHYERVEAALGATPYPVEYEKTPKTAAFREAARDAGLACELPNLAISFAGSDGRNVPRAPVGLPSDNLHDMPRTTCTLCGSCDIGCNSGAKNTLDFTYLSAAVRDGAEVRTCCEVDRLRRLPEDRWEVVYDVHDAARVGHVTEPEKGPAQRTVHAHHVVLAAGVFGTTRLLWKNLSALPGLSPRLGERVSANGDLLTFVMDCREHGRPRYLDPSHGPVITASVRVPDERAGGRPGAREHYVQDAGYPAFGELLWHLLLDVPGDLVRTHFKLASIFLQRLTKVSDANLSAELSSLLGEAEHSAAMLPLLGMGRDLPNGRITRENGRMRCSWAIDESRAYFEDLRETSRTIAETMGGRLGHALVGEVERIIASHPLGGCAMGRTKDEGVVDKDGNVFGWPGLHIADGSVMPGPVGPNPSLTIAALADRFADTMIAAGRP